MKNSREERLDIPREGMRFGCSYPFFLTNNQKLVVRAFSLFLFSKFEHGFFSLLEDELGFGFAVMVHAMLSGRKKTTPI